MNISDSEVSADITATKKKLTNVSNISIEMEQM
jgi:hypothetical protein